MSKVQDFFGKDRLEDVRWLCSLSDSELDMLIALKMLVLQRAKTVGHEELAKNFDLKVLRAIVLVLMEYLKGNAENSCHIPAKSMPFMDGCRLLQSKLEDKMNIEDLKTCLGIDDKKKPEKRPREEIE